MCGIVGQVSRFGDIDRLAFDGMRDTLAHRGPDGAGSYFSERNTVALGHRRLAILDLSDGGRQPMSNADRTVHITYNGEIYNYREIRSQLASTHHFRTGTDTEVILHAYEAWGMERTLHALNGMFAFGLYDTRTDTLHCARDRIGIKPLVYHAGAEHFLFASELKALLRSSLVPGKLDYAAARDYFLYRYVPSPRTIYAGISKLEPGTWLELNTATLTWTLRKYWDLLAVRDRRRDSRLDDEHQVTQVEALLSTSVERMLHADVSVDTFLSGGLDSSLMTALAAGHRKDLRAFSLRVASPDRDELAAASLVARTLNIEHVHGTLDASRFDSVCDTVIRKFDEPLGDTSIVPTYLLCEIASQWTKVALAGDGGDEMFYGYRWYDRFHRELSLAGVGMDAFELYRTIISPTFDLATIRSLLRPTNVEEVESGGYLFRKRLGKPSLLPEDLGILDALTFLVDDNLTRVDIASMAHSLEVRVPYLDHELVEFAVTLPLDLLSPGGLRKHLLRQVARGKVPQETIQKPKQGFSTPTLTWIQRDWRADLLRGRAIQDGVFEPTTLRRILDTDVDEARLWLLYVFEKWYAGSLAR